MLHPDADFDIDLSRVPQAGDGARVGNFSVVTRTHDRLLLRKDPVFGAALGMALVGLLCALLALGAFAMHGALSVVGSILSGVPFALLAFGAFRKAWHHVKPVSLELSSTTPVRHVRLTSIIWRADRGMATTARARVDLVLDGDVVLEGPATPELPVTEWQAARASLLPFALDLCRRTGKPLELVNQGFKTGDGAVMLTRLRT